MYWAVPMIEPVSVISDAPARAMPKSVTLRPSTTVLSATSATFTEQRLHDLLCDRGGHLAAGEGLLRALDRHGDGHLGVLHGREGDEPCLVRLAVRHLRGTGLAGHLDSLERRGRAGTGLHHLRHHLAELARRLLAHHGGLLGWTVRLHGSPVGVHHLL